MKTMIAALILFGVFLVSCAPKTAKQEKAASVEAFVTEEPATQESVAAEEPFVTELPTKELAIQERVHPEKVNSVVDAMLALNPDFQDPRISCESMPGPGIILGDSGVCIPQFPGDGFCVEGSDDYPCDMFIVGVYAVHAPGELDNIGGNAAGYVFEFMTAEVFERDFLMQFPEPQYYSLLSPSWVYITVIPASSANVDDMSVDGLGLSFVKSLTVSPVTEAP